MEKRRRMRGKLHRPPRQTFWITTLPNSSRQMLKRAKSCPLLLRLFQKHIFRLLIAKPAKIWESFRSGLSAGVMEDAGNFTFQALRLCQRLLMTCNPATGCCMCPTGGRKLLPAAKNAAWMAAVQSCTKQMAEEHLDMCGYALLYCFKGS